MSFRYCTVQSRCVHVAEKARSSPAAVRTSDNRLVAEPDNGPAVFLNRAQGADLHAADFHFPLLRRLQVGENRICHRGNPGEQSAAENVLEKIPLAASEALSGSCSFMALHLQSENTQHIVEMQPRSPAKRPNRHNTGEGYLGIMAIAAVGLFPGISNIEPGVGTPRPRGRRAACRAGTAGRGSCDRHCTRESAPSRHRRRVCHRDSGSSPDSRDGRCCSGISSSSPASPGK